MGRSAFEVVVSLVNLSKSQHRLSCDDTVGNKLVFALMVCCFLNSTTLTLSWHSQRMLSLYIERACVTGSFPPPETGVRRHWLPYPALDAKKMQYTTSQDRAIGHSLSTRTHSHGWPHHAGHTPLWSSNQFNTEGRNAQTSRWQKVSGTQKAIAGIVSGIAYSFNENDCLVESADMNALRLRALYELVNFEPDSATIY